jgi:acetyl esterase/lipase
MSRLALLLVPFSAMLALSAEPVLPAEQGKVETFKVDVEHKIVYAEGNDVDKERQSLSIYTPNGKKDFSVLVFVHHGNWHDGDNQRWRGLADMLASRGVGVVLPNHRYGKHPAPVQDVARAFVWTRRNIVKYGGRPNKIFVGGAEAGGHLAALLATDGTYLEPYKMKTADIRGVFCVSAPFTIRGPDRDFDEADVAKASPSKQVGPGAPPFLIVYGGREDKPLFDGCEDFCAALKMNDNTATATKVTVPAKKALLDYMCEPNNPVVRQLLKFISDNSKDKKN